MASTSGNHNVLEDVSRTLDFWRRATMIYAGYKVTQVKSFYMDVQGIDPATVKEQLWDPQHTHAGEQMYDLCVSLRGFYLKAGQFIGSRGDFVPEQICKKLTLLCDKVPPMSPEKTEGVIKRELGVEQLSDVFEWIDLDKPLGSASISQVHLAQLRRFSPAELAQVKRLERTQETEHIVKSGQDAWQVCNEHGISFVQLEKHNPGLDMRRLQEGQTLKVPHLAGLHHYQTGQADGSRPEVGAVTAVMSAQASGEVPDGGRVAVKVQYPEALRLMSQDLQNLRAAAAFLQHTELKFDLLSAVSELNKQIRLEFDFLREARVMDTIAHNLRHVRKRIVIPESVHGLVTPRLLVMHYVQGEKLDELATRLSSLSPSAREAAKRMVLSRVTEVYGRMILETGLFQADGHPGNILVCPGGKIALLDYGQSKQLPDRLRRTFAELVLALSRGSDLQYISDKCYELGIETEKDDVSIRTKMAYGMFDTRDKSDPFDPNSPLKQSAISHFPPDMFFVLRVVQLLRGMSVAMGFEGTSTVNQWAPFAKEAVQQITKEEPLSV